MPYVVFVASDAFGQKINLELEFPFAPTLGDLSQTIEQVFTAEQNSRRAGTPGYQVSKLQVVDEQTDDWVDVIAANQLRNFCQVYSFQPHSTRYTEAQGHIPAAVKPRVPMQAYTSAATPVAPPSGQYHTLGGQVNRGGYPPQQQAAPQQPGYAQQQPPSLEPEPVQSKLLPEQATHDDKVRTTFEEMDTNRDRVIQPDEFTNGIEKCELGFTLDTINELFKKADVDRDGLLNSTEWQRWGELYPSTLDCLYYRLKASYERQHVQARVDAVRELRAGLEDNEREALRAQDQLQRDEDEANQRASGHEAQIREAQDRLRDIDGQAKDQQGRGQELRSGLADKQRDLAAEKERERQAKGRAQESGRDLENAQRRQKAAEQGVSAAEAAEERAQKALEQAQREKQRQRDLAAEAERDAEDAKRKHDEIMGQIPQTVAGAQAAVEAVEREVQDAEGKARDLNRALDSAQRAADEAGRRKLEEDRNLGNIRDRKDPATRDVGAARERLADLDRRVGQMQDEADRDHDNARQLWVKENELCEQEVRLREQREMLEEKEGALRQAHTSFHAQAGRQQGNSPSRRPPPQW